MTVKELYDIFYKLMDEGRDNYEVLVDTEAMHYDWHMVQLSAITFETHEDMGLGDICILHLDDSAKRICTKD